jgi:hypothetical protein
MEQNFISVSHGCQQEFRARTSIFSFLITRLCAIPKKNLIVAQKTGSQQGVFHYYLTPAAQGLIYAHFEVLSLDLSLY